MMVAGIRALEQDDTTVVVGRADLVWIANMAMQYADEVTPKLRRYEALSDIPRNWKNRVMDILRPLGMVDLEGKFVLRSEYD